MAGGGEQRVQPRAGLCAGCSQPLGQLWSTATIAVSDGTSWHATCFVCSVCGERIASSRFAMTPDGRPCHGECHAAVHRPRCDVCDIVIAAGPDGTIHYGQQQFWGTKSCREHADDGTRRCACCCRLEKRSGPAFAPLPDDSASLCLDCVTTAVLSDADAAPLFREVAAFLRSSGAHLPYLPPLRLVPAAVLAIWANDAASAHDSPASAHIRGLTLVTTTSFSLFGGLVPVAPAQVRVTGIAILAALPRLATGSVMAHELCHAHLRLGGYPERLAPRLEEGLCELWALLWLEHKLAASAEAGDAQLGAFLAHQIRTNPSEVYGGGVRDAMRAYQAHGLARVMDHVRHHGALPPS